MQPDEDRPEGRAFAEMKARLAGVALSPDLTRQIDAGHFSLMARGGATLVVSFEELETMGADDDEALPFAQALAEAFGWSFLCLVAERRSWFRAGAVADFMDWLLEDGFFDGFDRVVFYGAGTAAHAACSYSLAAPGATVIAISPQATLTGACAGFDDRYRAARRLDFTSRFGYAPDMLDGAGAVHLFFDPECREDAAHAAQFNRAHIRRHALRHFGARPFAGAAGNDMLMRIFQLVGNDSLSGPEIARVLRLRRNDPRYLHALNGRLNRSRRQYLQALLSHNVACRLGIVKYQRQYERLAEGLRAEGRALPDLGGAPSGGRAARSGGD